MPLLKPGLCPLLTQAVVEKLALHGHKTVIDFICTDPAKIVLQCDIPHKTVLSIRRVFLAQYSSFPLNGANFYDHTVATISILPTGCEALDDLLASGIYSGEVTEIRGPVASGKSQLSTLFAVTVSEMLKKSVLYIDGSGGFSPERAAQLVKGSSNEGRHISETLSRIRVCRCNSIWHLFDILSVIRAMLNSAEDTFSQALKTVIIDSLTAIIDPALAETTYVDGQSLLTLVKNQLNSLAKDFAVAVVVVTAFDTMKQSYDKEHCPMGYTWSTAASTQLTFQRSTGLEALPDISERRIKITLTKSPHADLDRSLLLSLNQNGFLPT